MKQESIYVFSNGGKAYFPSNTLTNFTNKFPVPLEVNQNYEIGLESIGFSSVFKNVITPPNNAPSIIITNCNRSSIFYQNQPIIKGQTEGPIVWSFIEDTTATCHDHTPDNTTICRNQNCFYSMFLMADIDYGDEEISQFCQSISTMTKLDVTYEDKRILFAIGQNWIDTYGFNRCYIMMHKSFSKTFGFSLQSVREYIGYSGVSKISDLIRVMKIGSDSITEHYVRKAYRSGVEYDVFFLDNIPSEETLGEYVDVVTHPIGELYKLKQVGGYYYKPGIKAEDIKISLLSNFISLNKPPFPKTIKIVCDIIEPQIYNNQFSKNVLVYTPDFNKLKQYTTEEIESVDYMPLSNTLITDIRFQLLDENNEQLQLLPGPATWIKMVIREKPYYKKSFNIVLTSENSLYFEDNTQSSFRVKLPSSMNLDDSWKVCVSSLSHPSNFATFLPHENESERQQMEMERTIGFQQTIPSETDAENKTIFYTLKANYSYEKDELISDIKRWLVSANIGSCLIDDKNIAQFNFTTKGTLLVGETLAHVIGMKTSFDSEKIQNARIVKKIITNPLNTFKCDYKFNIAYMHPRYIMVYSNIIKPVLVAGEYRKLIRISPIENTELDFVTKYFRHKEFCNLENTLIDSIQIILASHDGRRISFGSPQDVIINLEFNNHADDQV